MDGKMARCANLLFVVLLRGLLALGVLALPSFANAAEVSLRDRLQVTTTEDHGRTWLELRDTGPIADMPANWVLHIDQVRFHGMSAVATRRDGTLESFEVSGGNVGDNWAPGGVLSFRFKTPGRDIANLWDPLESTCRHASLSIL